jgi:hypothetical protein
LNAARIRRQARTTLLAGVVAALMHPGCTLATDANRLDEGCPEGTKACDGTCVSIEDEVYGCARASCSPCSLNNAVAGCSAEGECIIASCVGSWEDCDRSDDNGCEIDIDANVENCGGCGDACEPPEHAEAACADARCYVRTCEEPFFDCNFVFEDGCEVNLKKSESHCGSCKNACDADMECVEGACEDGPD